MLVANMVVGLAAVALAAADMNQGGIPYTISNPESSTGTYSTAFTGEYFDVYGEVQTRYSQVYWKRNDPVPLPEEVVKRFDGKVMAITGYEIDQVVKTPEGDKSIPIYNAYNHHYFAWLTGKDAEVYDLDKPTLLPNPTRTGVRSKPGAQQQYPTKIVFKENPGGEFRKSYHGYPKGYAQLLHSPTEWVVEPMQIDTHNRLTGNATEETGYKPWFLPKSDDMSTGFNDPNSSLSPLIECPCSDRITRSVVNSSAVLTSGTCPTLIGSETQCRAAVGELVPVSNSLTIDSTTEPAGCLMKPDPTHAGAFIATFNTNTASKATCAPPAPPSGDFVWKGPLNGSALNCAGSGGTCLPPEPQYNCTGEFKGQCTWDSPDAARRGCGADQACRGFYCSSDYSAKRLCFGRSVETTTTGKPADQVWLKSYKQRPLQDYLAGSTSSLVNLSVSTDGDVVNVTLSGPTGSWFGVGFNAKAMADMPYAIVVDGDGTVSERKLVDHGPGTLLQPSLKVVSDQVQAGIRTVIVSRASDGASPDHYSFPTAAAEINLIVAIGSTPTISYHKARSSASLELVPTRVQSCLCQPTSTTYMTYTDGNTSTREVFSISCLPRPRGDMLAQHNPACKMETYHGGLRCCHHTWFLTDADQAHLIPDEIDTYYLKFRYYYEEYVPATATQPASHQHLHHWVFLIDAQVNDYEEVQCKDGTTCIGTITARLPASEMGLEDIPSNYSLIKPLVMTPHCHAPSCIMQELFDDDTGQLICRVEAQYGKGTGVFDELAYVAIPPCIWGSQPGLQDPWTIKPETNLRAIKYFNNSWRHLGQMAQWTGLMVYEP